MILIQADTLRRDHLDIYGYNRETAPVLERLAAEGVLFHNYTVQATWTKVSTPSLMTSLYPSTHGVIGLHRPPARGRQHACRSLPCRRIRHDLVLVGALHGPVHEPAPGLRGAARGRIGDRDAAARARPRASTSIGCQAWLERHRDAPFFVFLHVFDPHDPYEPSRPYDTHVGRPGAQGRTRAPGEGGPQVHRRIRCCGCSACRPATSW